MCLETMSSRSKYMKTDCRLRKTMTAESKMKWRSLRVFSEEEGAFRHYRYSAMQVTIRKYLRHVQRRRRLAKPSKIPRDTGKEEKMESVYEACVPHPPSGAMAPENTTQYLMSNVYEDMMADDTRTVENQTSARLRRTSKKHLAHIGNWNELVYVDLNWFNVLSSTDFSIRTNAKRRTGRCPPCRECPRALLGAVLRNESNAPKLRHGCGW